MVCLNTNQVPLSVSTRSNLSGVVPHPFAKPSQALVGLPAGSKAAEKALDLAFHFRIDQVALHPIPQRVTPAVEVQQSYEPN